MPSSDSKPCGCAPSQWCSKCWNSEFGALQTLAADNARLCGIVLAADELVDAIEDYNMRKTYSSSLRIGDKLAAYKVKRNGQ